MVLMHPYFKTSCSSYYLWFMIKNLLNKSKAGRITNRPDI